MTIVLTLFLGFFANGEKYAYPEQRILAAGVENIQISGVRGQIKLTGHSSKSFRLRVKHSKGKKYDDWSLAVDRRGNTLYFEVSSVAYGAQWRKLVKQDLWPEFDVELSGPPVAAVVSWREGDLEYIDWTAPVESSHIKGHLTVKGGVGKYSLQTGEGDVSVSKLAGDLTLKGESGRVTIEQLTGPLKLSWLSGAVNLSNVMGGGQLDLNDNELKISACQGEWTVKMAGGKAKIDRCSGKLTAQGVSTEWELRAAHDLETEIKSESGAVSVKWRSGGAKVFLTSESGEIGGPKVQTKLDAEGRKVAEFKVGEKPFGQVFVRTQSGPIVFKQ